MCLTDTTEYWWDVKRKVNNKVFTHKQGLNCGHFHVSESKKIKYIDCHACIKILKETIHNYDDIINPKPLYENCICGNKRIKRINKTTKEEFLGCNNWPKCKITSKI